MELDAIVYPTTSYHKNGAWRLVFSFSKSIKYRHNPADQLNKLVSKHYCEDLIQKLGLEGKLDDNYTNPQIPFRIGHLSDEEALPKTRLSISDQIKQESARSASCQETLQQWLEIADEGKHSKTARLFNSENRLSDEQVEDALNALTADDYGKYQNWWPLVAALAHDGCHMSMAEPAQFR